MRKGLALGALDLMGSLLLVVYALINPPVVQQHSAIETYGRWIIVATWPARMDADIDLWVRDPNGKTVWWGSPRQGLMHLEQDDLGLRSDTEGDTLVRRNEERVVLRGVIPGEYIVDLHAYRSDRPARVSVTLWRLQGADKPVYVRQVELRSEGAEQTAFRFSLDRAGHITNTNQLPMNIVTAQNPAPTYRYP